MNIIGIRYIRISIVNFLYKTKDMTEIEHLINLISNEVKEKTALLNNILLYT